MIYIIMYVLGKIILLFRLKKKFISWNWCYGINRECYVFLVIEFCLFFVLGCKKI